MICLHPLFKRNWKRDTLFVPERFQFSRNVNDRVFDPQYYPVHFLSCFGRDNFAHSQSDGPFGFRVVLVDDDAFQRPFFQYGRDDHFHYPFA